MRNFYIITNRHKDQNLAVTKHIENYLKERNCYFQTQIEDHIIEKIPHSVECILVLGGDGTLLRAAHDTIGLEIPLIGVNLGTLGYLAEVEQQHLEEALAALIEDRAEVSRRMVLDGRIIKKNTILSEPALNDIVLSRMGSLCILNFDISVNNRFLKGYHADGMIIATPTGSTGYNMSAGGPIVEPNANLMLLTPICPHTLNTRSIILAPWDVITIEIALGRDGKPQKMEASFDGNYSVILETGDKIEITQSKEVVSILSLSKVSFLEVLNKKMREV